MISIGNDKNKRYAFGFIRYFLILLPMLTDLCRCTNYTIKILVAMIEGLQGRNCYKLYCAEPSSKYFFNICTSIVIYTA